MEWKHGGAGIWSLHSCEPKGKGWGRLYGKFFLLPCDLQVHFRDSLQVTRLELERGSNSLCPLESYSVVNLNWCAWCQKTEQTEQTGQKLICRGTKNVVNVQVEFTKFYNSSRKLKTFSKLKSSISDTFLKGLRKEIRLERRSPGEITQ